MPKFALIIIATILSILNISGQVFSSEIGNGENAPDDSRKTIYGMLNQSMPIVLSYTIEEEECLGTWSPFESKDVISLEGECTDSTFTLYEIDDFSRVAGVITGMKTGQQYQLKWSNFDHTLQYPIDWVEDLSGPGELLIYVHGQSKTDHHIILHPHRSRLKINEERENLKWYDYKCTHAYYACLFDTESKDNINLSISDRLVSAGSNLFQFSEKLKIESKNEWSFTSYYNFEFPRLNEQEFDDHIANIVDEQILKFITSLPDQKSEYGPQDRFRDHARGDFYISLLNDVIISGFLSFYSTQHPKIITVPFTYDREKNRFMDIRSIWKKDFNYNFFLNRLIADERNHLRKEEEPIIGKLLTNAPFSSFNVVPDGLLFFTDYNFIYGRKSILLPFSDVSGFINSKALQQLINKTVQK